MTISGALWVQWPVIVAGVLYVIQCGLLVSEGEHPLSLAYFAYALANVGLIWAGVRALT